jgi:hypothetical protein
MAPVINIVIDATNNTGAVFTQVQTGLRGVASTTQQTTATMNAAFRGTATQLLGGLGIATGIGQVVGEMRQLAAEGQDVQASLDRTRGSLGAVLGSQARANDIFDQAADFADRYKITQQEMAGAIQASSQIIRTSEQPIANILSTLARLQVLSPEQGLEGAALALRELTSGDTRSLVGRFEVSRDAANAMKREIMGGADAVQVLGRYLDSAGITDGALEASLTGAAGQQRDYNKAIEELGIQINDVVTSSGWRQFQTGIVRNTSAEIEALQHLGQWIDRFGAQSRQINPVIGQLNQIEEILSRPLHSFGRWLGLEVDPLSLITEMREERDRGRGSAMDTPTPAATRGPVRFSGFERAEEPTTPQARSLAQAARQQGRAPNVAPPTQPARSLAAQQPQGPFAPGPRAPAAPQSRLPQMPAPQSRPTAQLTPGPLGAMGPGPTSRDRGMAAQIIVNIYPQGLVHSSRDLADMMRDAAKDDSFRNAIEVLGSR